MSNLPASINDKYFSSIGFSDSVEEQNDLLMHLATFPDMATDPIVEITLSGSVLYLNPAAQKIIPSQQKGNLYDSYHPFFADLSQYISDFDNKKNVSKLREIQVNDTFYLQKIDLIGTLGTIRIIARDLTEEKQIMKAAQDSMVRFQNLFNSIQDTIFAVVPFPDIATGRIIEINEAASNILGYNRFEFLNLTLKNMFSRPLPDNNDIQLISGYQYHTFENLLITKNKVKIPVEVNIQVSEIQGKLITLVIARDISKRKKSEESSKLNEARLESLLKIWEYQGRNIQEILDFALSEAISLTESKIGYIYFYDEETQEFTLNAASKNFFIENITRTPLSRYKLEDTGIWGEPVRQRKSIIINDFQAENPLKRGYPKGHVELLKYLSIPVIDKEKIVAVVGVANKESNYDQADIRQLTLLMDSVWNITNQRKAEQNIRESEFKYRSLFEDSVDAIIITSQNGNILDINHAAERLFGYKSDEVKQLKVQKLFFDPDDRMFFEKELEKSGFIKDHKVQYVRKDGTIIECLVTTNCWNDSEGQIAGYRSIIRDITEQVALTKQLKQANNSLTDALDGAIQALSTMSEARDSYTAGHQKRVAQLATAIAVEMGLQDDKVKAVHFAGLMHDIGKISIPAELLSKPNALSEIEKVFMQNHPFIGHEILKSIRFPWPICKIVLQHHERLDGTGYPKNLKGDEIIQEARVVAVADVVEAMSSHRPYRPALGIKRALEEIVDNAGLLYDPDAVKACLKLFREKNFQFKE